METKKPYGGSDMDDQGKLSFDFEVPEYDAAKLAVFGVGGAGGNAAKTMVEKGLANVTLMTANTDVQALARTKTPIQLQIGKKLTNGQGAGGNPRKGLGAAEESMSEIKRYLEGIDMLFVTAGMGGGTGTGAAPLIAHEAKNQGVLTVGVVTKPFNFEGPKRANIAQQGIDIMKEAVHVLITIPNQKLLALENQEVSMLEAFKLADNVLVDAVKGISELITTEGYVNLDFADVRTVMEHTGMAIMGTGRASGEGRALQAAEKAINSPLLDDLEIEGALGVLVNITGPMNTTPGEVEEAANCIQQHVDPEADFIFGFVVDETLDDEIKVTVIATGCQEKNLNVKKPNGRFKERDLGRNKGIGFGQVQRKENSFANRFGKSPQAEQSDSRPFSPPKPTSADMPVMPVDIQEEMKSTLRKADAIEKMQFDGKDEVQKNHARSRRLNVVNNKKRYK